MLDSVLSVVWIVGIINAISIFFDNMDGLAAGISAIFARCSCSFWPCKAGSIWSRRWQPLLCGSALGFLIYNFNPATTFMGDMGSLVLGFLLAVLGHQAQVSGSRP